MPSNAGNYNHPVNIMEGERIDYLDTLLTRGLYDVRWFVDRRKSRYCEFSGDGDLHIVNKVTAPLAFVSANTQPVLPASSESPLVSNQLPDSEVSPPSDGSTKLSILQGVCIEGKRNRVDDTEQVNYQLQANMIVLSVINFVKSLQDKAMMFSQDDILRINMLTGYGVLIGGDGIVGAYKLEFTFGQPTRFIEKVEIGSHSRLKTARIVDCLLEY